jgi:hypothetical protein
MINDKGELDDKQFNVYKVPLSCISRLWSEISDHIKHIMVDDTVITTPQSERNKNDPVCVKELYKYICVASNTQKPEENKINQGILKKIGSSHFIGHASFEEDKVVPEKDNKQSVDAGWLKDKIFEFFEAKPSIFLMPIGHKFNSDSRFEPKP